MNELNFLKNNYNISDKVLKIFRDTQNEIKDDLNYIDEVAAYNTLKVLGRQNVQLSNKGLI